MILFVAAVLIAAFVVVVDELVWDGNFWVFLASWLAAINGGVYLLNNWRRRGRLKGY
ncbi:MAG: hypothetical protein NW217_03615 [Hyphomicrobiaceae bacterium]|nr:hypothetical protein [Hyphomicrobiaceae bacterium]